MRLAAKIRWLFRTTFLVVAMLHPQISCAQGLSLTVSNQVANVSWPAEQFYYLLQTNSDLRTNAWNNAGSASALSVSMPGGSGALLTNKYTGSNFVFSQSASVPGQFFRLKAPILFSVFSFYIFYDQFLEFSDSTTLTLNGPVHANGSIYTGPYLGYSQTFNGTATATGTISSPPNAGYTNWSSAIYFNATPPFLTNVPSFISPVGTNNPHVLIEMPRAAEDPLSALGMARLFNQAQMLLIVTNPLFAPAPTVSLVLQGSYNGNVPGADPLKITKILYAATTAYLKTNLVITLPFLTLTNTFADQREHQAGFLVTQIDMDQLQSWLKTNITVLNKFPSGSQPTILFVADQRNLTTNKLAVVRLVNGAKLPYNNGLGFTLVTPNPLYVRGNYNTTVNGLAYALTLGSTTNGSAVPAALVADAVTLLSSNWSDAVSLSGYASRAAAANMTVNAAVLAGNVPSTGASATNYSGGVQNLPRLLENWSSSTLVLNTSLVCLFSSQMATNQFSLPYSSSGNPNGYYNPPVRNWGFDPNFYSLNKLPPGTPVYTLP